MRDIEKKNGLLSGRLLDRNTEKRYDRKRKNQQINDKMCEGDFANAKAVIQHACDIIGERYKDDFDQLPYVQGVTDLADSSVVIRTTFTSWNWTQDPISRALRQEIKEQLDNAGVEISYPKVQIVQ